MTWHTKAGKLIAEVEEVTEKLKDAVAHDDILALRTHAHTMETYSRLLQNLRWLRGPKWKPKGKWAGGEPHKQ